MYTARGLAHVPLQKKFGDETGTNFVEQAQRHAGALLQPPNEHSGNQIENIDFSPYLDDLELRDMDHDGRDLPAVVALEGFGHGRPERARGPIVHLNTQK